MGVLDEARVLHGLGFNPIPTNRGKKSPGIPTWQQYQTERATDAAIEAWWGPNSSYTGIWVVTGAISSLIVLDCDSQEADDYWHSLIGPMMDQTCCVKTSKGHHYWFLLAPGSGAKSWAMNEGVMKFDVKADGGGVMAPPSPHPEGGFYEWVRDPHHILAAPDLLLDGGAAVRLALSTGGEIPVVSRGTVLDAVLAEEQPRSLLSELLRKPPEEGGRNNWLNRVSGHMARIVPYEDAYHELVKLANYALPKPLELDEVKKTADSAWRAEKAKGLDTPQALLEQGIVTAEPDESNGWLVGTGSQLLTPVLVENGKSKSEVLYPWCDFDIKVLGSLVGEEEIDYLVLLTTQYRSIECRLNSSTLGSPRDLTKWLAERQGSIIIPKGDVYGRNSESRRLQRYVQSQKAPVYKSASALGWNDGVGGFIVHEGVIRGGSSEIEGFGDTRPASILSDWAPYRYGFAGTRDDARRVLAQVLTFHDETVTAVYGSWWAACFLKVQIMAEASLFPFMALEAPSESGKTTGFFALMMQLGGNYEGHGEFTMAALRDRSSGHRNGPVWIDDISDPEGIWDLVRQSTSEGSRTKKQADRHRQERVALVAPIVVSAEGMASLNTEKALADRAIKLTVPSPTGRRSVVDPTRPQWDDILNLQAQYQKDLTQLSGHYVSMALEHVDMVDELRTLRPVSGRHGDKLAILRLGARILANMTQDDTYIEKVDAWCDNQEYYKGDNILTTEILPWAWRMLMFPRTAKNGAEVYVNDENIVCYNEQRLADLWSGRRDLTTRQHQLGTIESIRGQRRDLGIEGKGHSTRTHGGVVRYHRLNAEDSMRVIERSGFVVDDTKLV